ncbi:MAG: HNH endonuclease [Steroidobacteraceae bacterium]
MNAEGHAASVIARALDVDGKRLLAAMHRLQLPISKHGRRSGVTDAQIAEMVAAYVGGEGTKALAVRYELTDTTIARYLRQAGVEVRPAGFQQGEGHHAWKGGRVLTDDGYVLVLMRPDDPFYEMAQVKTTEARYCLEHRLVMARHLGRPLTEDETVHHIDDRDKQNNDISNLQLRFGNHGKGAAFRCLDCGSHNIGAVPLAAPSVGN